MGTNIRTLKAVAAASSGQSAASAGQGLKIDNFTATASQTLFTLSWAPNSASDILLFLGGTKIDTGYTVSVAGTSLTISPGLPLGSKLTVVGASNLYAGQATDYATTAGSANLLDGIDSTGFLQTSDRSDAAPPANTGTAPVQGTSTQLAREDHQHGAATELKSASGIVEVGTATAPTAGQVLTAVDADTATWQTPSAGGGVDLGNHFAFNINPSGCVIRTNPALTKLYLVSNQGTGIRIIRVNASTMAQEASVDTSGSTYMSPTFVFASDTKIFLVSGTGSTTIKVHRFDATTLAFDTTLTITSPNGNWLGVQATFDYAGQGNLYVSGFYFDGGTYRVNVYRVDTTATPMTNSANYSGTAVQNVQNPADIYFHGGALYFKYAPSASTNVELSRHNPTTLAQTNNYTFTYGISYRSLYFIGAVGNRLLHGHSDNASGTLMRDVYAFDTNGLVNSTTMLQSVLSAETFRELMRSTSDRYRPLPFYVYDSTNDTMVSDTGWSSLCGDNQSFAGSLNLTSQLQMIGNYLYNLPTQTSWAGAATAKTIVQRIPFKVS